MFGGCSSKNTKDRKLTKVYILLPPYILGVQFKNLACFFNSLKNRCRMGIQYNGAERLETRLYKPKPLKSLGSGVGVERCLLLEKGIGEVDERRRV